MISEKRELAKPKFIARQPKEKPLLSLKTLQHKHLALWNLRKLHMC
jgi:hypothetical protein